jgi:ATP-binding cassette, subfamily B, multidrug efflux pump
VVTGQPPGLRAAPRLARGRTKNRWPLFLTARYADPPCSSCWRLLQPTGLPERPEPPPRLIAFYWHFARQAKGLFIALFVVGLVVALLDSMIPVFIGRLVTLVTASTPDRLFAQSWPLLLGMALLVLVARPLAITAQNMVANQAISANVQNLVRWQSHWHVARQSWAFFQNDFAGRIANRVMQTGPAIRESLVALITGVWYIVVYGTSAVVLLAAADRWLALPVLVWFAGYVVLCGCSCRACATARTTCRKRAPCSPAGWSIPTATS